jgi:hypothetical protein
MMNTRKFKQSKARFLCDEKYQNWGRNVDFEISSRQTNSKISATIQST